DVDFTALAAQFVASGGDIKNGVLKAAASAAAEPGPDAEKRIHQRHFVVAMEDVMAAKSVMQQSLFSAEETAATDPMVQALQGAEARWRSTATISVGVAVIALAAALVSLGATIAR
ncbi:MAG TPA: hypothetical protein VE869_02325, partial [Gemmatimonas sp.]|nr:hypothetical protein [Gemmatimonas sp.]